jgi:hypothetical protein
VHQDFIPLPWNGLKGYRPFALEKEGRPSKWITMTAHMALRRVREAA